MITHTKNMRWIRMLAVTLGALAVVSPARADWLLDDRITAGTNGADNDRFGYAVAISGEYAIVGAYLDDDNNLADSGSAYIFSWAGSGWGPYDAKITAGANAQANAWFGDVVAIDGDYAIVGADHENAGSLTESGAAYIFVRSGSSWPRQARLTAESNGETEAHFGNSVSISGSYAIVGAHEETVNGMSEAGAAYIFVRSGTSWSRQARLTAGADTDTHCYFGYSVSLSGDYAIVGMHDYDGGTVYEGAAYVFQRSGTSWSRVAKLTASDAGAADYFGVSVSISGDCAIVGSFSDDWGGMSNAGSAYIFEKPISGWADMTETAKLTASDAEAYDYMGLSVAISGDYAIVGAQEEDENGTQSGSAYIFEKPVTGWADMTETAKVTAGDEGDPYEYFGTSVDIDDSYASGFAIVGCPYDYSNHGSAFIFERGGGGTGPVFVRGFVPDWNQPYFYTAMSPNGGPGPDPNSPTPPDPWDAWCAPTSAANLAGHWDDHHGMSVADGTPAPGSAVMWAAGPSWQDYLADGTPNRPGPGDGAPPPPPPANWPTDIGYCMDTNNRGNPGLGNPPHTGTYLRDIHVGLVWHLRVASFSAWWRTGTQGRGFAAGQASDGSPAMLHPNALSAFQEIAREINADRTMIVCFTNWNIRSAGYNSIPGSGEGEASYPVDFYVFDRGEDDPWENGEEWNYDDSGDGLGHAVTAVGYLAANDSLNPAPGTNWVIVHDNVSQTPRNVAVPLTAATFGNWTANTNANRIILNCPGDLDFDGDVDLSDLAQLLSNYGTTEDASYEQGDIDEDGDVDLADLAALLAGYGQTCQPPLGACCVAADCVGTIEESECIALGGQWFEGEDCFGDPPFECEPGGPQDLLLIRILTDNWASETTWDLYEQGGGLIASGDPDDNNTLYEWEIPVEPDKCYDFTIYDSYGDGICCAYGEGYYEIELNGELVAANYNFHGSEDTVAVGGGCAGILGACCVDGVCVDTVTFSECGAMFGEWYAGEDCFGDPPFQCPGGPENDDCSNATPIMEVLDLPFDTTEATFDGDGQCMVSPNIWYCFTAMTDGMVYVATCGSGYDTMLAVYDGCSCDPLPPLMECNDDSCGLQSEIMFPAVAGSVYLIEVGGYSSHTGHGVLTVMHP